MIKNLLKKLFPIELRAKLYKTNWLESMAGHNNTESKQKMIAPIILRTQARSGSTYLMQLLANFPDVVTTKVHPYEIRIAQYYAACYKTLSGAADHEYSSRPNYFNRDKGTQWIGTNPFNNNGKGSRQRWFKKKYNPSLKAFFRSSVEDYYQNEALSQKKVSPLFYCEKSFYISRGPDYQEPAIIHSLTSEVTDIFLVRNPLDILVSQISFFIKNQELNDDGIKRVVLNLAKHMNTMANDFNEIKSPYIVRYEQLINSPEGTLRNLCQYLGLNYDDDILQNVIKQVNSSAEIKHITSKSAQGSINRWEHELSPEIISLAKDEMKEYISCFGYSY